MAIVACTECGHQVSDHAASCPSCGAPIAAPAKPKPRANRTVFGVLFALAALCLIAAALWWNGAPTQLMGMMEKFNHGSELVPATQSSVAAIPVSVPADASESKSAARAVYQTTAEQLYRDYNTNAVATQSRIGGSRVRVTGTVAEIDEDASGHPLVKLWASNDDSAGMLLSDDQKAAAAELAKGETVDIQCDKMRHSSASPQGSGCALVSVSADTKQAYLAVLLSSDRGSAPLFIVGPMSEATCLTRSDGMSAQLSTDRRREHIVSKNCAATARESIPSEGCRLSSSMSAMPDLPSAHLWRYDCIEPAVQRPALTVPPSEDMAVLPAPTPAAAAMPKAAPPSAGAVTVVDLAGPLPQNSVPQNPMPQTPVPQNAAAGNSPVAGSAGQNAAAGANSSAVPDTSTDTAAAIPSDLLMVKTADPGAADRIDSYCNTATAAAADRVTVAAGCRHQEVDAWTRLVLHNEFPSLDEATRRKCNQPPFPDSYVAKESCARYELRIN